MTPMSWWILPTTADIGLRAFAASAHRLIEEITLGMQSLLLSEVGANSLPELKVEEGVWQAAVDEDTPTDLLLVRWLEDVLYQAEVENRWLVALSVMLTDVDIRAQVSFVDAESVEREVEIKAVTRHELMFQEVPAGVEVPGAPPDIPSFEGPGWMAQVIFDI
ncbi:MAG: hypothetical protein CXX72_01260 [Methanobacteriota archaeon]|nr:MAG: hypothetical protein CXX72_01260 [Euryarchaeota archaeon]